MDPKVLEKILAKALGFIYSGENERPVRALNFRPKKFGGLGLIHPFIESKSFLIKSMLIDYEDIGYDNDKINELLGASECLAPKIHTNKQTNKQTWS